MQKENTFESFLLSWAQYSIAIISFAESHKSTKELKRCFRDDNDDPDADSEYMYIQFMNSHNVKHQCTLCACRVPHCLEVSRLFLGCQAKEESRL